MLCIIFQENYVQHEIFQNIFLGSDSDGDFSEIKSSIRNSMNDFEFFFIVIFFK